MSSNNIRFYGHVKTQAGLAYLSDTVVTRKLVVRWEVPGEHVDGNIRLVEPDSHELIVRNGNRRRLSGIVLEIEKMANNDQDWKVKKLVDDNNCIATLGIGRKIHGRPITLYIGEDSIVLSRPDHDNQIFAVLTPLEVD